MCKTIKNTHAHAHTHIHTHTCTPPRIAHPTHNPILATFITAL